MTTCAETRTTIADLSPEQRSLLAAVAVTPTQHATLAELSQALDWSEQKTERVAHSLPQGITTGHTQTVHLRGIGLWPEGRTLANEARDDAQRRAAAQLQMIINEGAME